MDLTTMSLGLEYILLVSFFVLMPIYDSRISFPKHLAAVERGEPDAKVRLYRETLFILWAGAVGVFLLVALGARSFTELGFTFSGDRYAWIGLGLAALLMVQVVVEQTLVRRNPALQRKIPDSAGSGVIAMTPSNDREWKYFIAISFSAGFCEELLYRGFLFLWLEPFVGLWPAALISSLAFGLAHAYQGFMGILKTALVGAVMMFLVWLSGSLWPAIILHTVIDLGSGRLFLFLSRNPPPEDLEAVPAQA